MNNNRTPIRVAFITILIVIAVPAFLVAYLSYGVYQNARHSSYARLFNTIGQRAIQLDRIGVYGWVNAYNKKIEIPAGEVKKPESINCASDIKTERVDLRMYNGISALIISYRPLKVILVYNGAPPDFRPFLSRATAPDLLGPTRTLAPEFFGVSRDYVYDGVVEEFDQIIDHKTLEFESSECGTFSFTTIEEK